MKPSRRGHAQPPGRCPPPRSLPSSPTPSDHEWAGLSRVPGRSRSARLTQARAVQVPVPVLPPSAWGPQACLETPRGPASPTPRRATVSSAVAVVGLVVAQLSALHPRESVRLVAPAAGSVSPILRGRAWPSSWAGPSACPPNEWECAFPLLPDDVGTKPLPRLSRERPPAPAHPSSRSSPSLPFPPDLLALANLRTRGPCTPQSTLPHRKGPRLSPGSPRLAAHRASEPHQCPG